MSTPIVTARRNLVQRISNLLRKAEAGVIDLTPWQIWRVHEALEHLKHERFPEGERTMSEAELPELYEPAAFAATPIAPRHLVDQLTAVVAAV